MYKYISWFVFCFVFFDTAQLLSSQYNNTTQQLNIECTNNSTIIIHNVSVGNRVNTWDMYKQPA